MRRDLDTLAGTVFDVLVIGGGILGASIARDAALRGLVVALVEREDWACGTSSNSLRIVHGGLRYLQHLDVRRMRQSIRERSYWLRVAPHLVEPLPVLVPTHGHGVRGAAALRAALAVNDLVAWDRNERLHPGRTLPAGRAVSRAECLALVPEVESRTLTGGVLFHDAQMYSSERLVLETVIASSLNGATVANHVEVDGPLREGGRLAGVHARDQLAGGRRIEIRARVIVNAAGPATSSLMASLQGTPQVSATASYTVALNLGVDGTGHSVAFAMNGRASDPNAVVRRGSRQLFVVPWRGRTLIGTAHLPYARDPASFRVSDHEIAAFLSEVNEAWPGRGWSRDDLRIVQSGLLPGRAGAQGIRLDKRHRIVDHGTDGGSALISATSVKFTTARLVAEECMDLACARLGLDTPSRTNSTLLPGAPAGPVADLEARAHRAHPHVAPAVIAHLVRTYGKRYVNVLRMDGRDVPRDWLTPLGKTSPVCFAQFVHGARYEMACTTDDLVARRTELGAVGAADPEVHRRAAEALSLVSARPAERQRLGMVRS